MEQYEKQYSDTVTVRNESQAQKPKPPAKSPGLTGVKPRAQTQPQVTQNCTTSSAPTQQSFGGGPKKKLACHQCNEVGHFARNCTHSVKTTKSNEAPGRSDNTRSCVATVETSYVADDLTVEQLEELLSRKRLIKEQKGLKENIDTISAVTASNMEIGAVGPTLFLDISIEGEKVEAMVDCGSPTTIISHSLLHSIARNMKRQGCNPPELMRPVLKLYGKDGKRELVITAQTKLTMVSWHVYLYLFSLIRNNHAYLE